MKSRPRKFAAAALGLGPVKKFVPPSFLAANTDARRFVTRRLACPAPRKVLKSACVAVK